MCAEPIIRPALFADPAFAVPNVMNVLANLAGFSILLLTPYYLVNVLKLSAVASGLVLALAFVGSLIGAPLSARLVARIGQRPTAFAGVAVVGLGLLPLAFTGVDTPVALVALLLIARGRGPRPARRRLHRHRDLHARGARPRRRRQPLPADAHARHRERRLGADGVACRGAAGLSGIDGFLAGYRYAFLVVGGGLLVALVLSLAVPRAWSQALGLTMLAIRLVKTAMVASTALFALLVAYNNLADYDSNYEFVRHTLSMDTTFPDNALKGRAITSPTLWTLAYWSIILAEAATGLVLAFAAFA